MIVFNLPESKADHPTNRIKDDCLKFKSLLANTVEFKAEDVTNVYRLGPSTENQVRARPLLIKGSTEKIKWNILKASKNLKFFENNQVTQFTSVEI